MLARLRKAQTEDEGFTLIELLVVMIIIGILAAIAIPVFLSQRAKAQDSATKADASTVGKEVATHFVDNTAAPVLAQTTTNYTLGGATVSNRSANVSMGTATFGTVPASAWCVPFSNPAGSKQNWVYSAAGGLQEGSCATGGLRAAPTP